MKKVRTNAGQINKAIWIATVMLAMSNAAAQEMKWETDIPTFGPVSVRYGFARGFDGQNCAPIGLYRPGEEVGPPFTAYIIGKFTGADTAVKRLREEIRITRPDGSRRTKELSEIVIHAGGSFCFWDGPYSQGELPSAGSYGWEFVLNDVAIGILNLQVR